MPSDEIIEISNFGSEVVTIHPIILELINLKYKTPLQKINIFRQLSRRYLHIFFFTITRYVHSLQYYSCQDITYKGFAWDTEVDPRSTELQLHK